MKTEALIDLLAAKGIRFERDGDELLVDGPDDALTDELIADIKEHKRALMQLANDVSVSDPGELCLRRMDRDAALPLSFAQQRIWYLEQLESGKATYNLPFAYRIKGALEPAALERCLQVIIARHNVLGTTFAVKDGAPVHRIDGAPEFILEQLEFDAASTDDGSIDSYLLPLAMQPFDLERGPLFRATLVEIDAHDWVLLVVAHHTVFDGASIEIFEDEIAAIYPDVCAGRAVDLSGAPIQYVDFAAWQTERLTGQTLDRLVDQWLPRVGGRNTPLNLPVDYPYPAEQTYNGGRIFGAVARDRVLALRKVANDNNATLFMVLIAAFLVALRRFCGENDITIGFPVANRTEAETERLIGFFANTLPLRSQVDDEQSLEDLIRSVRDSVIECIAHSELPFEKLVESINPPRDLARSPVFQALVSYQEGVRQSFAAGALDFRRIRVPLPVSRLDVSLFSTESDNELDFVLEYNTDVFDAGTAERLLNCVQSVLTCVAEQPDATTGAIDLVTSEERGRLLGDWNATERNWPALRIERLIDAAAPADDAIAIRYGGVDVSYGSMARQSDRIAAHLRARGVDDGDLVGIYMERSHEMVIAMLGVMKAGAGYVPLDPEFPPERLSFMLQDSAAKVVITQPRLQGSVPDTDGAVFLFDECIESGAETPAAQASRSPDAIAYVLYTSGSTGWPKGVVVPHRCVTNFLRSMWDRPGLAADDILLSVTTASFDISVLEFFLPLTVGATVVIADAEDSADSQSLRSLLEGSGATVMQATPSTWRMLLDAGWDGDDGLKALCGGEPLPQDLACDLVPRCGELWNMYGPTETTIWSTCQRIDDPDAPISIGTPIANTTIYVLDEQRRLAPVGVRGEIWIGGAGVSDGYLNRPDLTDESFVTDPFTGDAAGRMYRTGDLARWRTDGTLQHLGRLGGQVKIRGYRIELGEIESVLGGHDDVSAVACSVWQSGPGDQRLVAHILSTQDGEIRSTELRKFLRKRLPDYMIPQFFEPVDEIPLTPNGKIDRSALKPPTAGSHRDRQVAPPETEGENVVAEIWKELIGISIVGRHDFFFDLGGHSLLAVRAASEIERRLGRRPHLKEFILDDLAEIANRATSTEEAPDSDETRKGGLISRLLGRP